MQKNIYNSLIDHTFLKPDATQKDIDKLIEEGLKYQFKTICVNPTWVKYVSNKIANSSLKLTTVIGFPLGATTTATKIFEAKDAVLNGADEIDMVLNIGNFKDKKYDLIVEEIKVIKKTIAPKILKVIIETALLTESEITKATKLVIFGKADFVKTSTGFSTRGASFNDIQIISKVVKGKIGIKASGGIKTFADLKKMITLGATRIGTSSAVMLLKGQKNCKTDY